MADRIKGITIEIDGNTTKLSKSLEGVNKDIKTTKAALRDVDNLLKLDPTNIDLLKQRQDLLNNAVGDTKEKLATLKEALSQMDASGVDKASAEYQSLQREILSTEKELNGLESAASKSNAALAKVGATAQKVGENAGKVANATKGLSTAAAGLVGGLAAMGLKAAASADDLNTMAKQTGFSTESLQKMQYAADRVDVSVETITGAAEKMKAKIKSSESSFEALGVSVKNANGEYRQTEDIFNDVVAAIGGIENETERDIAAMNIFGKSASELAGILDDGGQALKALGDEAANKGLIIPQEDLDRANELNDTMDELKATLNGAFGKAAVSVLEALAPVLEKAAGGAEKLASWLSNLNPTVVKVVAVIAGIIAVISPIAGFIATIGSAISVLTPIISAIIPIIGAISAPVLGVVAAIAAAIAIGVAVVKNWDTIKEKAGELHDNIAEKFSGIKEAVVGKFTEMKENAAVAFDNVKEKISNTWNDVKEKTSVVLGAVKDTAKEKLDNMKKAFEDNGGGIKGTVSAAWEGIKGYWTSGFSVIDKLTGGKLSDLKDQFTGKFNEIVSSAATWGRDIIQNLIDGITGMIDKVKETVGKVAQTIKDFLGFSEPEKGPLSNFHTYMPDMIDLMNKGIKDNLYKIDNSMQALSKKLVPETEVAVNYNNAALSSMFESVNKTIAASAPNANITVVLEGDAKNLFKMVRQQNRINTLATGRNALAF